VVDGRIITSGIRTQGCVQRFRAESLSHDSRRDIQPSVDAVLFDFAGTLFMPLAATVLVRRAAQALGVEMARVECAGLAEAYLAARLPLGERTN
jgi:hypothetical protein